MVAFESLGTVSYLRSTVTMGLSCVIFEIKRDIGKKNHDVFIHPARYWSKITIFSYTLHLMSS